jgi:hydroxymethylpyrimidine/phosphomethylpyrimidine kinase
MLGNRATVDAVVEGLTAGGGAPGGSSLSEGRSHEIPIVVDPVLVSTSGGVLLDAGGRAALIEALFPLATLITPNVPEAAALLGEALATDEDGLVQQGQRLLGFGSRAILVKGGHRYAGQRHVAGHSDAEDAVDLLIWGASADGRIVERIASQRIAGTSRGTGCALASAIAAGLAAGKPLNEACRVAKNYVLGMLTPAS